MSPGRWHPRGRSTGGRSNGPGPRGFGAHPAWGRHGAALAAAALASALDHTVARSAQASMAVEQHARIVTRGAQHGGSHAPNKVDLVLSSGFLSFANHAGFLKAVEDAGLKVDGIMGTSAGALSGSLYAAGFSPAQVAYELSKLPPMSYLQVSQKPWEGGILNMDKVIARYRELLPPRFEDLGTDFAVGVYTRDGKYRVIDSGPLPEAVVASAAIPFVFEHVDVPGVGQCMDGGKHDRVGLTGWSARERRRGKAPEATLVHLISRSSPFSGNEVVGVADNVVVCRSPKSGVSLTSLGDFEDHFQAAYERSKSQLSAALTKLHD